MVYPRFSYYLNSAHEIPLISLKQFPTLLRWDLLGEFLFIWGERLRHPCCDAQNLYRISFGHFFEILTTPAISAIFTIFHNKSRIFLTILVETFLSVVRL